MAQIVNKPTVFEYQSFSFQPKRKRILFHYRQHFQRGTPLEFTETILLPRVPNIKHIPPALLQRTLESIHLMLGVSYAKLYLTPQIKTQTRLTKQQASFWQTVYRRGLGELFYRNKITPVNFKFPVRSSEAPEAIDFPRSKRMLVGIGGGKDSIAALELLKRQGEDITGFVVETGKRTPVIRDTIRLARIPALRFQRFLDPTIYERHPEWYRGHIPVSTVFAWLGYLAGILYDYSSVVVANEHSSNFGNITYHGETVNHQWSKSVEFEALFQNYTRSFVSPDVTYFSLLRPLHEIRITKIFSRYPKYFPVFTSCNRNFSVLHPLHGGRWCGQCAKCSFVFTMLAAWLPKATVVKIFGKNLLADEKLLPMFTDLAGKGTMKPFDCVGTFEEMQAALFLARKKFATDVVMKKLFPRLKLTAASGQKLVQSVMGTAAADRIPTPFRLAPMNSVLIVGYAKEGKMTHQYLRRRYPWLKIGIADKKDGPGYLSKQANYDIAVKTPGIPKRFISIPYVTATNLFLSQIPNLTIGVTGSKGKSTTASLIAHILKTAGKPVQFLGNIGSPMLGAIMQMLSPTAMLILELSSYQLDDIEYSPRIAVATNLFPEHLPYHGGLAPYYQAKKNIILHQRPGDVFVYNPRVNKFKAWAKETKAAARPFVSGLPLAKQDIPLIGQHNYENIRAAVTVARLLNVSEAAIKRAIRTFKPLSHRLELVGEYRGIKFYDDAISTTPESTIFAIQTLKKIGTIFLGGEDRGYDFRQLEKTIHRAKIKNVVLFPDSGPKIIRQAKGLNVLRTRSMEQAMRFAYKHTPAGSICLLSCASPSYSLWRDFIDKGNQFQAAVKKQGR